MAMESQGSVPPTRPGRQNWREKQLAHEEAAGGGVGQAAAWGVQSGHRALERLGERGFGECCDFRGQWVWEGKNRLGDDDNGLAENGCSRVGSFT